MKKSLGLLVSLFIFGMAQAQVITPVPYEKNKAPANNNWGNGDGSLVWTNGDSTLCWRNGAWTPETANAKCDGAKKISTSTPLDIKGDTLFVFDKTELTLEGREKLDKAMQDIASATKITAIYIFGYTDSFGAEMYNLKLSQARADSIKNYLISKGYGHVKIESFGRGKTALKVDSTNFKGTRAEKIAFEQPNRRVEIEVKGFKEVAKP